MNIIIIEMRVAYNPLNSTMHMLPYVQSSASWQNTVLKTKNHSFFGRGDG